MDGSEYKQLTSHRPKFFITDVTMPVVTISYLDQEKMANKLDNAKGTIYVNSLEKILDEDEMFNYACCTDNCTRFDVLVLDKSFIYI